LTRLRLIAACPARDFIICGVSFLQTGPPCSMRAACICATLTSYSDPHNPGRCGRSNTPHAGRDEEEGGCAFGLPDKNTLTHAIWRAAGQQRARARRDAVKCGCLHLDNLYIPLIHAICHARLARCSGRWRGPRAAVPSARGRRPARIRHQPRGPPPAPGRAAAPRSTGATASRRARARPPPAR